MTGQAAMTGPGDFIQLNNSKMDKKKKKTKLRKKGSDRDSDSSSTSSGSSVGPPIDGLPYSENVKDWHDRHNAEKHEKRKRTRGSRAERRRRSQRSRSTSTATSLTLSGSEVEALERLEENKTTSTALKKLWKNMKYLQEKIQKLEDALTDSDSDVSERQSRTRKKNAKQEPELLREKEVGNESKEEKVKIGEEATTSVSAKDNLDPESSKDDAETQAPAERQKEGVDELDDAKASKESDKPHGSVTSEGNEGKEKSSSGVEDDEKASDGDDEDSSDEDEHDSAESSEEDSHSTAFELKSQFFYQKDVDELNRFYDDKIEPFIRVRWDDVNDGAAPENSESAGQKGKVVAGEIDILQICIESPVFKSLIIHTGGLTMASPSGPPQPPEPPGPGLIDVKDLRRTRRHRPRADDTLSFYRPFRWLIQNRELLEEKMKKYKGNGLKTTTSKESLKASQKAEHSTSEREFNGDGGGLEMNLGAQIKFLLDFMDEHLAEPLQKYRNARAGDLKTIGFEDLWMLYKPGDIIYCQQRTALPTATVPPAPSDVSRNGTRKPPGVPAPVIYRQGFGRDTPQAYKIISVVGGRRYASPIGPRGRMANTHVPLKLICYFLDIGGYRFDVVTDTFTFRPFDTEMVITDLDAYPLAYASDGDIHGEEGMRKFLAARGKSFVEVCEASHKLYAGAAWTDSHNNKEEIDTPVIVDFALAYQNIPSWRPPFCVPYLDFYNSTAKSARAESLEMTMSSRTNRTIDWYYHHQSLLISRARAAITETVQGYPIVGTVASDPAIPELIAAMEANEDILLLPGLAYAFALRDRKWVALDLTLLQDTQYEDGWKDLILPAGHKEMVRAVVENHAAGSRATGGMKKNSAEVDIVRGKGMLLPAKIAVDQTSISPNSGKGCIILLHGEPGVGKTSTAECVAAFTKRPLFPITCGDIGYEPDEVERNLQKHFTLAHKWGCVMLLDEADVFLAKRSRDDIKRNGLVSVFLRILEYYAGILFLTTNRVGSFDDAFRSRLHLTLYYPKLDRKQTQQIFEMNIRRVRELNSKRELAGQRSIQVQDEKILKFARKHFETLSWNGRQIRNAFQTAIALAEFDVRDDGEGEGERQAVMGKKQFKTIAHASIQFDSYLWHTHGGADQAAKARREQVHWDYEVEGRPDRKPDLIDSSSDLSSDSSSSSSDSSSESSESSADGADSTDSSEEKRRKRKKKKGKGKDKKSKKSESKSKKSRSKKDKHN